MDDEKKTLTEFRIKDIYRKLEKIDHKLDNSYVSQEQMKVLETRVDLNQRVVFGALAVILISFMSALVGRVIPDFRHDKKATPSNSTDRNNSNDRMGPKRTYFKVPS